MNFVGYGQAWDEFWQVWDEICRLHLKMGHFKIKNIKIGLCEILMCFSFSPYPPPQKNFSFFFLQNKRHFTHSILVSKISLISLISLSPGRFVQKYYKHFRVCQIAWCFLANLCARGYVSTGIGHFISFANWREADTFVKDTTGSTSTVFHVPIPIYLYTNQILKKGWFNGFRCNPQIMNITYT